MCFFRLVNINPHRTEMMMTSGKGGPAGVPSPKSTSSQAGISQIQEGHQNHIECCMCGDFGLTSELFRCKLCKFRSQHRYCSNIYPKAESYSVCNWCLNEKEDTREKTQNSSTSNKNPASASDQDDEKMIKIRKKSINIVGVTNGNSNVQGSNNNNNMKGSEKGRLQVDVNSHSIKKQKSSSPERSPLLAARKRITTATGTGRIMQENLRRTKSDVPKGVVQKHVFRNKVRRYKLLDEVSS